MRNLIRAFVFTAIGSALSACATHDYQDAYLLGDATRTNIAEQSVRDIQVPNSKPVGETSGVRGANAVKALNEGKRAPLREAGAAASGDS